MTGLRDTVERVQLSLNVWLQIKLNTIHPPFHGHETRWSLQEGGYVHLYTYIYRSMYRSERD